MRLFLTGLLVVLAAAAQSPAGEWVSLFEGDGLGQWRGMKGSEFPAEYWKVEDGCLTAEPAVVGRDIVTVEEFSDFELALEWKVAEGSNSGVKYLVDEETPSPYAAGLMGALGAWLAVSLGVLFALRRRPRIVGPVAAVVVLASVFAAGRIADYLRYSSTGLEMQILDNERHANGQNPLKRAGSLYGLIAASPDTSRPAGRWNTARIRVDGNHVEHSLNGVVVVRYELGSPDFEQRLAESHFAGLNGFGSKRGQRIVLQHHGDRVWFRNVRIRRLESR